jgi:2-polyprenyl-3-methyl-5-hydroxy-6-metoxy-1,4-benzoquinol methylase
MVGIEKLGKVLRRREFSRHEFRKVARRGIMLTADGLGYRQYHPLYGLEERDREMLPVGRRPVTPRWELIAPRLPESGSAMDIGSQHGWYVFMLAQHGLVSLGVDQHEPDVRLSQWLALYNGTSKASFIHLDVNPDSVKSLPAVDVVLCMSVFHHWARLHGLAHAEAIMQALADRCRDRMFFETGQPGESDRKWHDDLSFIQPTPEAWSSEFLQRLGFDVVAHLGDTKSGKAKKRGTRSLMLAQKSR